MIRIRMCEECGIRERCETVWDSNRRRWGFAPINPTGALCYSNRRKYGLAVPWKAGAGPERVDAKKRKEREEAEAPVGDGQLSLF